MNRDGVALDDTVSLAHSSGSSASIALYGAQVLSWVDAEGRERLYLSRLAHSADGIAIRGGIPVIFPQFGAGPLPKHGFLRTRKWALVSHNGPTATFRITDDASTYSLWPHHFVAELNVELSETLRLRLAITNTGDSHFAFTTALHNYFAVDSIEAARVRGLAGLTYIDKTAANAQSVEKSSELQIDSETDRIYVAGPREVAISCAAGSSSVQISAKNFSDWVVWNPWRDGSASISDMEPEDYHRMLCVEAGRVVEPMELEPGSSWVGEEIVRVAIHHYGE